MNPSPPGNGRPFINRRVYEYKRHLKFWTKQIMTLQLENRDPYLQLRCLEVPWNHLPSIVEKSFVCKEAITEVLSRSFPYFDYSW